MRKKILSFIMAVLAVTSVCSAQTEKYKGDYYFYRKSHNNEVINLSYNMPVLMHANGSVENLHGVSLDYTRMISLCEHSPLFIESGIGFGGYFGNKFTEPVDETWTDKEDVYFITAKVPVNFGYKINFNNQDFIFPYMGIYLRSGLWGHYLVGEEEIDAFSKSTVGDINAVKYFQCGWGCGVRFTIGQLGLGVGIEKDFHNMMLDTRMTVSKVSVGYVF